jgi:hypothetical protein
MEFFNGKKKQFSGIRFWKMPYGSISARGPEVMPKRSASREESTYFLCCIAVIFRLFLSHLLPHWSKRHDEKNLPSICVLISQSKYMR